MILIQKRNKIQSGSKGLINPYKLFEKNNQKVEKLVQQSQNAIDEGLIPTLTIQGTSGAYMIKNKNQQTISIFKPFDQQVNGPNNPRQKTGKLGSEGISKGILSGQCATREVAAYLLDNDGGNFHAVPITTYVQFYHPTFVYNQEIKRTPIVSSQQFTLNIGKTKHGSLQQFINSEGLIGDYGCKVFSEAEIHKIGILDIRILNCDRNQQNILVKQLQSNKKRLIPIDHGLSFPDNLEINQQSIVWMNLPQSKTPFSKEELKFIQSINPEKDTQVLQSKLGFRNICLRNFKIAEIFLKKAAAMGFTLFEIGKMLYRTDQNDQNIKTKRSNIQTVVIQAQNLYLTAIESMQKQNIQPIQEDKEQLQLDFQHLDQNQNQNQNQDKDSQSHSTSTCQSIKNFLALRKKVSLPQLKKKDSIFHENRQKARKEREGINGISKTIWNKYHQEQWNQLFYYYFQNLIETLLFQKSVTKGKKMPQRTQSAK